MTEATASSAAAPAPSGPPSAAQAQPEQSQPERAQASHTDPSFDRPDPGYDDHDSALGDGESLNISSTASISSSILNYRKIHGRTYQNFEGAEYYGPNDPTQNEALDIAHHMMYLALDNRLYLAPLDNPQKVLDVATGTGIWAIDFADENPSAEVIGTELSPIQPSWVPPNCKFELDNAENEWTYADNSFDYIHVRGLLGCIQDWEKLYRNVYRCLKPGGWFEHHEFSIPLKSDDGSVPDDSVWTDWNTLFRTAGEKMGRPFNLTEFWEDKLRDAGFTGDIHRAMVKLPVGGWAADARWKEVGLFNRMSLEQGLEGFANYICHMVMGYRPEETEVLLARVRNAIKNRSYHAYYPLRVIYIQKPLA
ncbi:hypothetical protein RB595_008744 [Gaeumannomyces hyphopodioides]